MPRAIDVAGYLLSLQDEDAGDTISNLKLQKLLYYAQGFWLAERGVPLFDEPIEAWQHGPVVPAVYRIYCDHGRDALPPVADPEGIDRATAEFLNEIYSVYGQFSAWKLSKMTHEEPPWKATPGSTAISHEVMRRHFETQLARA